MLLVSPAEPIPLRALGTVSSECERIGADFLFTCPHGLVGIQRKEIRDLVASIRGDRIAREIGQSTDLYRTVLLVEGDWKWRRDGVSGACPDFTRAQWDGLLLSFQEVGWYVMTSASLQETIDVIGRIQSWFSRASHNSLRTRPKSRALWGAASNHEWGRFLLQSFDGVGIEMASRIYAHFDGIPLAWTCTEKDFLAIDGIGPKRARSLVEALRRTNGSAGD